MRLLFDTATEELHAYLAEQLHNTSSPTMVVRHLRQGSNDITIDLLAHHRTPEIDRFVLAYCCDAEGNRAHDGVNLRERSSPRTITAIAGTLGRARDVQKFASHNDALAWMRSVTPEPCDSCGWPRG